MNNQLIVFFPRRGTKRDAIVFQKVAEISAARRASYGKSPAIARPGRRNPRTRTDSAAIRIYLNNLILFLDLLYPRTTQGCNEISEMIRRDGQL